VEAITRDACADVESEPAEIGGEEATGPGESVVESAPGGEAINFNLKLTWERRKSTCDKGRDDLVHGLI
jgi:hypothetical protein